VIKQTMTVALVIGSVLAGTSVAHATTATATKIPEHFLLTERGR
jgi:hypothetical protein